MSGLTPGGWPYATEDDFAVEWPAVSEALAVKLDGLATGHRTTVHTVTQSVPAGTTWATMGAGTAAGPDAGAWAGGVFTPPMSGVWRVVMRVEQTAPAGSAADVAGRVGATLGQSAGRLVTSVNGGVCVTWQGTWTPGLPAAPAGIGFTVWHSAAAAVSLRLIVVTEFVGS